MFFSLNNPLLYLSFIYFIASVLLSFFIPGDVILKKFKLPLFQRIVLGTLTGMAFWITQGFLLGFLNLRFLTYPYLIIFFVIWFRQNKNCFKGIKEKKQTINYFLIFLITFGVLVQVLSVWFTGIKISEGIYFCCGNIGDSLYHIALTNQIVKQIPPLEPGIYGVVVQNYHYLSNLIVAELVRVFRLPLVATQYQFITVFISLFLGLSAISFAKSNKMSKHFTYWLLFFLYFGGDFIYLTLIILGKGLSFQMGSLEDGSIFLVNPPRAFSIVLFFGFLSLFSLWIKKKNIQLGIIIGLVVATLIGLKVYVGVFALFGLGIVSFYFLLKKETKVLIPLLVSIAGSALFYFPVNSQAGGLYFTSFWIFENFIVQPQFELGRLELARNIFKEHHNWIRVIQYELIYIGIYMFSILGTKILGFIQTKKSLSSISFPVHIVLLSGLTISVILGFFFQQEAGGSNTFNFIVSVFIISSIYTALAVSYWFSKFPKTLSLALGFIIILLTIPRVVNQTYANIIWIYEEKGFILSNPHLEAINYLKENTESDSLILVDSSFAKEDENSPFISFLLNRPMFLSGKGILDSHKIETEKRDEVKREIVKGYSVNTVAQRLRDNGIDYILTSFSRPVEATLSAEFLREVFINSKARIYKVSDSNLKEFIDTMDTVKYEN